MVIIQMKKLCGEKISAGLFLLLKTELNRIINIYYLYDEDVFSPYSFSE
jgi:hypothetical protein